MWVYRPTKPQENNARRPTLRQFSFRGRWTSLPFLVYNIYFDFFGPRRVGGFSAFCSRDLFPPGSCESTCCWGFANSSSYGPSPPLYTFHLPPFTPNTTSTNTTPTRIPPHPLLARCGWADLCMFNQDL